MSERMRDPNRKKARELKRDHRVMPLRGDKSMRKTWRRKKALANRRVRRLQTAVVRRRNEPADDVTSGVNEVVSQRRRKHAKAGVVTLEQHLAIQKKVTERWHGLTWLNTEAKAVQLSRLRRAAGVAEEGNVRRRRTRR